jgi:tetratricopeptide (TPR) repeat protein
MKRFLALALVISAVLCSAWAESPDDQYVRIYNTIQEADALNTAGKATQALTKYLEAQTSLERFRKIHAEWNPKVISFRANYVAVKITAVSAAVPAPDIVASSRGSTNSTTNTVSLAHVSTNALDTQLNSLRDQVRQMQVDKIVLEAKLKESLAAQPAVTDPRELAKAEDRIKTLQKENALLKVNLTQSKTNVAPGAAIDSKTLLAIQQSLAESNRKLAEQTDKANALATEKATLQQKLNSMAPAEWNASALETAKKALEQTSRQLTQQKELTSQAAAERDKLQARLTALTTEAEAASALRSENQILKKQLADLRSTVPAPGKTAEGDRQLAAAQAQIAALQSDKDILRLEKMALESRVKLLALANSRAPSASRPEDVAHIRQLERDRDDLQKKLEAANKELVSRTSNKAVASRILDMENQMAALRARLEVFESRAVPYSSEELALFKRPEVDLAAKEPNAGKKPVKALPAGSAVLVADAQRYFSEKQFDKAEEKYLQVLRQDDKNVPTLANLATIQIERNRLEEAEKHIKQAVTIDPNDSYSWLVLGQLKFRQEKYDDALDALSRAAKLDPQDAQVQNYLGITLSQKGMRGPAETALRKAIQLEPGNASAHHNLAVVYLTQKPPLIELAKWHYQKALAGGHPRNPEIESMFDGRQTAAAAH